MISDKRNIYLLLIISILLLILGLALLIDNNRYPREDVNRDGRVDALDLLIVQKKIIHDMEEDDKNENIQ